MTDSTLYRFSVDNYYPNPPDLAVFPMIYRLIICIVGLLMVVSCSSKARKTELASEPAPTAQEASAVDFPTGPVSYADYKRWREANDPAGELYANFKEWQAAYKKWQQQQQLK